MWSEIKTKLLHQPPLGQKINITNRRCTLSVQPQLGSKKKKKKEKKRKRKEKNFYLWVMNDRTSIRFGSTHRVTWIEKKNWITDKLKKPGKESNYHKPYAWSLWSGCKLNWNDDKEQGIHKQSSYFFWENIGWYICTLHSSGKKENK